MYYLYHITSGHSDPFLPRVFGRCIWDCGVFSVPRLSHAHHVGSMDFKSICNLGSFKFNREPYNINKNSYCRALSHPTPPPCSVLSYRRKTVGRQLNNPTRLSCRSNKRGNQLPSKGTYRSSPFTSSTLQGCR